MQMFGVDKRNLGSFGISRTHDFEKLFSHDNVKVNTRGEKMVLYDENTGEKFDFQCITITKDERFESLHLGVKKIKNAPNQEYITLQTFIEDDEKGTANLVPVNQKQVIESELELLEYIKNK